MHDEFEMSMMGELNFFLYQKIKQIEDEIFFNQSKYIKEMLKKFGLKDSKPTKTPMSTEIKLTKDDKADSIDSTNYQALGWHLEEIHVTWGHLEKKRTRLQLYTKVDKENAYWLETASGILVKPSEHQSDDVKTFVTALELNRLKEALENSVNR
ncbi:retrovirus-related pol polyprotein from transposon TNT 1-94, partial [Tanacetum coccineum]